MSINKDLQTAPNLRFKGFTDDWEQRKLNEVSIKVTEKNKDNMFVETFTNSAEFGIINQRDYFDKDISNEKNLNTYYIVRNDDFVYNPRISNFAPVGPINRNKLNKTGVMSPLYYVFSTHDINKAYLENYFNSSKWHKFMKLNGDSGARSDRFAIKDSVFNTMPIPYPNLLEQDEIGKFINYVENVIALHQRKLDQLNQLKQALLQQMFPGKGETAPKLRFAGFEGDWEERKLGDILEEFSRKSKLENEFTTLSSTNSGMEVREGRVSGNTNIGYKIIENDDLVLSPQNLWLGNINLNNIGTGLVSPSYKTFKIKNSSSSFLNPQLRSKRLLNQYELASTQGASVVRRNLDMELFYQITLLVPVMQEQNKIGSFFKSLDNTITLQQRKLDQLKNMKQVLLQNMFI